MRYDLLRLSLCSKICPTVSTCRAQSDRLFLSILLTPRAGFFGTYALADRPKARLFCQSPPRLARGFSANMFCARKKASPWGMYTPRLAFLLGYATASRGVPDPPRAVFLPVLLRGSSNFPFGLVKFFCRVRFFAGMEFISLQA